MNVSNEDLPMLGDGDVAQDTVLRDLISARKDKLGNVVLVFVLSTRHSLSTRPVG